MARKNPETRRPVNSRRSNKNTESVALVVVGVHRSGTSALARMLSASGCTLPKTLLPAHSSNEAGFFESVPLIQLNEKILRSASANWRSWQSMPAEWHRTSGIQSLREEAIATLEAEFDSAPFILLKDPRFCRLMRFWLPVLGAFGKSPVVVCPIRNPIEVAASLEKRDGLPRDVGLLIWLRYQLEAEYDTRGLARAFTNYNGLLADWRHVLEKIAFETGLNELRIGDQAAEELATTLSPTLHHHRVPDAAALHDEAHPEWVRSAYAIFLKWSETREDPEDHALLDQIRNELNTIPRSLQGILHTGDAFIENTRKLRKKIAILETEHAETKQKMLRDRTTAELAGASLQEAKAELAAAQHGQAQLQQLVGQKETEARHQEARNAELQAKLDGLSAHARALEQHLAQREAAVESANARLQEVKAELAEAQQDQAQLQQLVGQKEAEARHQKERNTELQNKLDGLTARAREVAQREAAVESASARLQEAKAELAEAQQGHAQLKQLVAQKEMEARHQEDRNAELQAHLDGFVGHTRELGQRLRQLEAEAEEAKKTLHQLQQQTRELGTESHSRKLEMQALALALEESEQALGATMTELDLQQRKSAYLGRELDRVHRSGAAGKFRHAVSSASRQWLLRFSLPLRQPDRDLILHIAGSFLFDRTWYLQQYSDVAAMRMEPALHYLSRGAHEMRDPGPRFSTRCYLEKYPDVAESGFNPLVHFELFGREEGREIGPSSRMFDVSVAEIVMPKSMPSPEAETDQPLPENAVDAPSDQDVVDTADFEAPPQDDGSEEIAGSELFDPSWYLEQYPDVAAAQIDPALHYLHFGADEMRDPGPNFNTRFYLEKYPDVVSGGINPLVHYELFGRQEGRQIRPSARTLKLSIAGLATPGSTPSPETENAANAPSDQDVVEPAGLESPSQEEGSEEIAGSELFDPSWYLERYPDVAAAQIDPALHYLRFGAGEMRDPGPRFNTRFYLEKHADVASSEINALAHYELFGRQEGREIAFSNQAAIVPGYIYSPAPSPDEQAVQADDRQHVRWKRFSAIPQHADGLTVELRGQRLGWLPIPGDQDEGVPTALVESLSVFGQLTGLPASESIRFLQDDSDAAYPGQARTEGALDMPIAAFPEAGLTIESAWYLSDQDMRVRFSSSLPDASAPCVLRYFQYDPAHGGSLALVGEHLLLRKELEFADLGLINGYLPILITLSQPDARLMSATLLPYPSLCQGGAHFPELLATGKAANSMESLREASLGLLRTHMSILNGNNRWELGSIDVDLRGATSAERIFSRDFKEWLWAVMRIKLKAAADPSSPADESYWREALGVCQSAKDERLETHVDEREQSARLTMVCPSNAVPSIHALVAGQVNGGFGSACALRSFVVADAFSWEAHWRVEMPSFVSEWRWAQPEGKAVGYPFVRPIRDMDSLAPAQEPDGRAPLAVLACDFRPPHPSTLILPVAPEISGPLIKRETKGDSAEINSIHCIYACERFEEEEFVAFLESLRLQKNIELENIFIALYPGQENDRHSIENVMEQLYPDRFQLVEVPGERTDTGVQSLFSTLLPDHGGVLWVTRNVVLHDPRTLETLWQIAREDRVASAGCLLLRSETKDKSQLIRFASAGVLPVSEQFSSDRQFVEMDCLPVFSRSTYPVAANNGVFHVTRADVWKIVENAAVSVLEEESADVDFFITASGHGYRHFCTTLVSAELRDAAPERPGMPPGDIQAVMQATSVTLEVLKP